MCNYTAGKIATDAERGRMRSVGAAFGGFGDVGVPADAPIRNDAVGIEWRNFEVAVGDEVLWKRDQSEGCDAGSGQKQSRRYGYCGASHKTQ